MQHLFQERKRKERLVIYLSEFNPFDIPEEDTPGLQDTDAAPRKVSSPSGPVTATQTPKSPKQPPKFLDKLPKNKFGRFVRRFWIPIVLVLAVILILAIFGNAIMVKIAPTWAIGTSAAKTTKAIEDRIEHSPYRALEILGGSMISGTLGLDFTYEDDWDASSGSAWLSTDLKNRSLALGADVTVNGQQVDGELFLNKERAAVRSSYLPDCYGVTYATFEEDLRASALPDYLGLGEEEIREASEVMEQIVEAMEFDLSGLIESYTELGNDFMKELDFASASEKTLVGGKKVSCTAVSATLKGKQLRSFVMDGVETFFDDESVRDLAITAMLADGYYTADEARQAYEQTSKEAVRSMEATLQGMDCDLDLIYYLYKGQLVKIEIIGSLTSGGDPIELEYSLDFGRDPSEDDWVLSCVAASSYGDEVSLTAEYESDSDSKSYADTLSIEFYDGYDSANFELSTDWNRQTGDLQMDYEDVYGSILSLFCNLKVDGDQCTLTFNDFGDALYYDGATLELILTADKAAKIENPDFVNLDKWDDTVLEDIQESVQTMQSGGSISPF